MAEVLMVPQCECGYVFDELHAEYSEMKTEFDTPLTRCRMAVEFEPFCCPNCRKPITSIRMRMPTLTEFTFRR